ncbi:MAG: energy transducer TonB [Bacteroidales bacterium]
MKKNIIHDIKEYLLDNLPGILGTIAFHLVMAIIFFGIQISRTPSMRDVGFLIEFPKEKPEEKIVEEKTPEELADNLIRRNIGVNVADKVKEEINTEKFIDQFRKELDLGDPESFREKLEEIKSRENEMPVLPEPEQRVKDKELPQYTGPTNIYYDLENRHHRFLPVPVYKCQGRGKVKVEIIVNQSGNVTSTSIMSEPGDTDDECLAETALETARITTFNADYDAPVRQRGTITYHFISQ